MAPEQAAMTSPEEQARTPMRAGMQSASFARISSGSFDRSMRCNLIDRDRPVIRIPARAAFFFPVAGKPAVSIERALP